MGTLGGIIGSADLPKKTMTMGCKGGEVRLSWETGSGGRKGMNKALSHLKSGRGHLLPQY